MHDESAMSDVTMAIGENIRKARERKGLRQEQVAEMAGIPRLHTRTMSMANSHHPATG
ncbi:helix-turn-helix domain-containing protein [Pseudomonas aeruginosa]|uniref:helix-turn-helix domain-containing protein n=1 Tax=Pseudomonas aeruginosa TaxID=287 RepID=UPI00391F2ACA